MTPRGNKATEKRTWTTPSPRVRSDVPPPSRPHTTVRARRRLTSAHGKYRARRRLYRPENDDAH